MDRSVLDDDPGHTADVYPPSSPLPPSAVAQWMSGGVIAVVVLGSLCLVLGVIYAYIYFTRINPRAGRTAAGRSSRKNPSQQADDGASIGVSTHVFLFKKS